MYRDDFSMLLASQRPRCPELGECSNTGISLTVEGACPEQKGALGSLAFGGELKVFRGLWVFFEGFLLGFLGRIDCSQIVRCVPAPPPPAPGLAEEPAQRSTGPTTGGDDLGFGGSDFRV